MEKFKNFLLICLVLFGVGCNLQLDDGEKTYTLTTSTDELDPDDPMEEVGTDEVLEEMNFDLIKMEFNFVINWIRVIKVDRHGMTLDELGEYEVVENLVYVPEDVEMKGFYLFEFFNENYDVIHTVVSPGNTLKNKKHGTDTPQYLLGEKDLAISEEVLRLVYDMGYPLGASYHFVSKHFYHSNELTHENDDNEHFYDDEFIHDEIEESQNDDYMEDTYQENEMYNEGFPDDGFELEESDQ
jgi:hypothetical protein